MTVKYALVTGASAGIGKALAEEFARQGYGVILVARRREQLDEVAESLFLEHRAYTHVLTTDLSSPTAAQEIFQFVEDNNLIVEALVNNAGFGLHETFCGAAWKGHADSMQVMMTTLTELCHLFAPLMTARGKGYIINVASLAAYLPPLKGSLYTAIKAYVIAMSQALDLELKPQGVNCTALCPGFTHTEFHEVMDVQSEASRLPEILWMDVDVVAKAAYRGVKKGSSIVIPGRINKLIAKSTRGLPDNIRYTLAKYNRLFE